MKNLSVKFLLPVAGTALLSACGDDVTKVYMENQVGVGQVASFGEFPKCTVENIGEMLYATDSGKVYSCADSAWVILNSSNGKDEASSVDTLVVSRTDTVVIIDTVLGLNGSSCTAETLDDGSGYRIVCGGDSVGVVLNGSDGKDGLAKVPEGNFSCSEYDCVTTAYLNPALEYGELLDKRDGKVYRTIEIGSQVWMAQNLDFYDSSDASFLGQVHCFKDSLAYCKTYGRLYTWKAAMGFDSAYNSWLSGEENVKDPHQGICPEGWHLPSIAEWDTLVAYVDAHNDAEPVYLSFHARYLWESGSDRFGWSALPGGNSWGSDSARSLGNTSFSGAWYNGNGYWWSTTIYNDGVSVWSGQLGREVGKFSLNVDAWGVSVRCVKD